MCERERSVYEGRGVYVKGGEGVCVCEREGMREGGREGG